MKLKGTRGRFRPQTFSQACGARMAKGRTSLTAHARFVIAVPV
jgi:hypothetical protein